MRDQNSYKSPLANLALENAAKKDLSTEGSQRLWLTNLNYNDSRNWDIGRVPCEADRIIMQDSGSEGTILQLPEGKTTVQALVLPSYSEIVLPENGALDFFEGKISPSCNGQDTVFKHSKALRWIDPQNWNGWNLATPDLERVPCTFEMVLFPAGTTFNIITPPYVKIGSLGLGGVRLDSVDWMEFSDADEGSQQFRKQDGSSADFYISGQSCSSNQWCECGNEYLQPEMCTAECPVPTCKAPITPNGFCCPICGAYFLLKSKMQNKMEFSKFVNNILKDKDVIWHASKTKEMVQVVVVNDGDYNEEVTQIAEDLKGSIVASKMGWTSVAYFASGHVWYPISFGQIVSHFLSLLVFATFVIAGIIMFYSRDWTWLTYLSSEGRPFLSARYQNLTGEVQVANEEIQQTPVVSPKSFENPLYGATGQDQRNVTVENPVYTELEGAEDSSPLEVGEPAVVESSDFSSS